MANVWIKQLDVEMEVKTNGVEFEIQKSNGNGHRGDLIVSKAGLTWCKGKTNRKNGTKVTWDEFIAWMEND